MFKAKKAVIQKQKKIHKICRKQIVNGRCKSYLIIDYVNVNWHSNLQAEIVKVNKKLDLTMCCL